MQARELEGGYRLTVGEMSRQSHLDLSTWFNGWFNGGGEQLEKLQTVSAISTQVILRSRIALYRGAEKLPDGTYDIEDGLTITLPLTEAGLNNLPASLVVWLIDAAGRENAIVLEGFLAAVRVATANMKMTSARLSANGPSSRPTPH